MSRSPVRFFSPLALCSSALLLLLLSGCASQQIETKEATPSVEIPSGWDLSANNGEQDWPDSSWWKRFGSDELSQLVAQGKPVTWKSPPLFRACIRPKRRRVSLVRHCCRMQIFPPASIVRCRWRPAAAP
ncbi:hypothetical protein [Collimonas arenae]|uniref:hypothetical protein n=1 Tax=Collimonas arenae TaxID=279058 RepID=UPI001F390A8C|nr:hypothetical protein [Collimonas arenae]